VDVHCGGRRWLLVGDLVGLFLAHGKVEYKRRAG
jgi:hypothetical protein